MDSKVVIATTENLEMVTVPFHHLTLLIDFLTSKSY